MDEFFQQIAAAADHSLYFLALAGALMIPDICGALGSEDGIAHGHLYKAWAVRRSAVTASQAGICTWTVRYNTTSDAEIGVRISSRRIRRSRRKAAPRSLITLPLRGGDSRSGNRPGRAQADL